jgi:hypothetical protein
MAVDEQSRRVNRLHGKAAKSCDIVSQATELFSVFLAMAILWSVRKAPR